MNNLILGELKLLLATHTTMNKQELLKQLINAVDLKLVITTPGEEKVELSIGEFLNGDLEMYDGDTGIQIEEVDFTV